MTRLKGLPEPDSYGRDKARWERFGILLSGIVSILNDHKLDGMEVGERIPVMGQQVLSIVRRSWGIGGRGELLDTLRYLTQEGYILRYQRYADAATRLIAGGADRGGGQWRDFPWPAQRKIGFAPERSHRQPSRIVHRMSKHGQWRRSFLTQKKKRAAPPAQVCLLCGGRCCFGSRWIQRSSLYASSVTASSHSLEQPSSGTSMARWENQLSGAAPCQCFTSGGMLTTSPGRRGRGALPHSW